MIKHFILTLTLVSCMLLSCKKDSATTDTTQYYTKCTNYDIVDANNLILLSYVSSTYVGNDTYDVIVLTYTTLANTGEQVVSGTATRQYSRIFLNGYKLATHCHKSIVP